MDVILDSNAYRSDYRMESDRFGALFGYLRKADDQILLFRLVQDEVLAGYSRDFREKVLARWEKLRPTLVDPDALPTPELAPQLNSLRERLRLPGGTKGIKVAFIDGYTSIDVSEVVRRGVERVPPASAKGEELRDVILWLCILARGRQTQKPVAFITNDSGFWQEGADEPRDQIKNDIAATGNDIRLYRSIEAFLAVNSLPQKPVTADWALDIFARANLGHLLVQRVIATNFPSAEILSYSLTAPVFDAGALYQIGVTSQFAELSYKASFEVDTRTIQTGFTTSFLPTSLGVGPLVSMSSLLKGAYVPPSQLLGGVASRSYDTFLSNHIVDWARQNRAQPTSTEVKFERIRLDVSAKFSVRISGESLIETQLDSFRITEAQVNPAVAPAVG